MSYAHTPALKEYPHLFAAVESFINSNSTIESTVLIEEAITAVGACTTFEELFASPIQSRIFGIDAALRWILFLGVAPTRSECGERTAQGVSFGAGAFSPASALSLVIQVYDIGVQDIVLDNFEDDEDDDGMGSE